MSADITMDNDGAGTDWFFDQTPLDDAEFTGIANAFQASFIDVSTNSTSFNDFYRTITHEIGHALGIAASPGPLFGFAEFAGLISNRLLYSDRDQNGIADRDGHNQTPLRVYVNNATELSVMLTSDTGGHFYEGHANDPAGLLVHPDQLMNPGRSIPPPLGDPIPTTRQFVSDLTARLLADAYGYTVTFPSNVVIDPDVDGDNTLHTSSMHATFDSQTGTLLLQGGPSGSNETFSVVPAGDEMVVTVSYFVGGSFFDFVSRFKSNAVSQIVIARNGGSDTVSVNPAYASLVKEVQYVVSTNQDSNNAGTLGDNIVDIDTAVPGAQVPLRAAIMDANGFVPSTTLRAIYVPRGSYQLSIHDPAGTAGASHGDLDVFGNLSLVGAGAGATVIDATPLRSTSNPDRIFDIDAGDTLSLYGVTLTGGRTNGNGGAINVNSGATLHLTNSVVAGNETTTSGSVGGGIFFMPTGGGTITSSVIVANSANGWGGGLFLGNNPPVQNPPLITMTNTIVANNIAATGSPHDIHANSPRAITSGGGNRVESHGSSFTPGATDHVGAVTYVVTDLTDTFDGANDPARMTIRDAVSLANGTVAADEIWLPAWKFRLTRERTVGENDQAMDIGQGDIEIMNDLTIRGVNGSTSVAWRAGAAADEVFELMGDYNGNGTVDTADSVLWQTSDGDDDDDIGGDQGDYDAWHDNYDSTFTKIGVA
jgi:hypothetical protein